MKELRDYQVADLSFYMRTPRCLNTSDPGTGKTPSVCVYLWYLWNKKKVRSVWTMPKSLLQKNRDELMEWGEFEKGDVMIVDGPPAKRAKQMASDAKVFLMGFDCFSTNWRTLLDNHPDIDMHASDEVHMGYGGAESQRTLNMFDAMEHIKHFLPMTGTIVNGRYSSVYPCMHVINKKLYPEGYTQFLIEHAVEDMSGRIVAWMNPEKIQKFLGKYSIRHTLEEVYGKENKQIFFEKCPMEKKQREAYDEFEGQGLLELEESWLDGSLPGVNFIRCRQIMEHPQEFGPPLDKIKYTGKEERLKVHLEQARGTGKPLVIFSALRPQQDRLVELVKKYGLRVGLINGRVSTKKRFEIDEQFTNGELDVIVASPATAGVGFNWGHTDTVIFASVDPMDSSFVQGYRRAIRGKRDTPLSIYVLEYEDSMDQHMFEIIDKKSKMANDVDPSKERLNLQRTGKKRINMKPTGSKLTMEDFER
jgi:SNF2 family DNA or RNA helicase